MDEYLAMIKMFAGNFAPKGFMLCQGQILNISQNTALFALLGTTFGGNGQTTFGLPDLRGRVPVGTGNGPGLTPITWGQVGGTENVTLTTAQMPAHTHTATITITPPVNGDGPNSESPEGNYPAPTTNQTQIYNSANSGATGASFNAQATIGIAGGSQPVPIRNPYLGMNYVICTSGLFPSRD